ncbi:hypothetical protein IVB45_25265 [Bradyrhizobium sp. 4]|uniref:hypothetical protein n=1 Tax=unclassified Bradyrhizobium TaxID=2631580 RepID=UPI001FF9618B|nr:MULTISPECIES: hypothetical protein [unclassified Bradyrhizobium]MCK1403208.1 hypothetical protein [Bradyrhizobium sp. 39]MCK1748804.1 hypothetical protein [Bradyrhizobium sp. 135]UPJ33245.1 hypothetical protein IVB45_25265 [Bradyrhizobium sp. 4]
MQQHQQNIDELARMERICLNLAGGATMPEERAGLLEMASNYAAAGQAYPKPKGRKERDGRDGSGFGQAPCFPCESNKAASDSTMPPELQNRVGAGSSPATPASEIKYLV